MASKQQCVNPILLTKTEWQRIQGHCDPNKNQTETQRKTKYVQYLDQLSREMTRKWPNSLENVNKRNEEIRQARIRAAEKANEDFYSAYCERQQEEQRRLMEQAREAVFKNKDAPKMLLRAVLECATQNERGAQLRFNKALADEEAELDRQYAEHVKKESSAWLEEQKNKKKALFLYNKANQREIVKQKKELIDQLQAEKEEELRLEIMDNAKGAEQMAQIAEFERVFKENEKQRIKSDMEQASQEVAARRHEEDEREKLDEELRQIYLGYKHTVDCRRAQTEVELQKERLRVLEGISKKLSSGTEARDRKEQEILAKAVKEKDEMNAARHESDRRKKEALMEDRKEQRRQFLREEAQRKHDEETFRKWQMLNRFKNDELNKEYEQKLKEMEWQRTLQHRADLIALWKERDERDAREKEDTRYFYGELAEQALREADNKVLRHAELLRREAEQNGWPWLPLHRAVESYRKLYSLFPARPLPRAMKEHFQEYEPEDRTFPKELPELAPPNYQRLPKRYPTNGLQDREKERMERKFSEEGYKREGRQNGLQTAPTKEDESRATQERQSAEWKCYQGEQAARRLREAEDEVRRHAEMLRREMEHAERKPTLAEAVEVKVLEAANADYRRQGRVNGMQQKPTKVNVVSLPISGSVCPCD